MTDETPATNEPLEVISVPETEIIATPFQAMSPQYYDHKELAAVQRFLMRQGPTYGSLLVAEGAKGRYGHAMQEAVKRFQTEHNLEADGVLNARTVAEMGRIRTEEARAGRAANMANIVAIEMEPSETTHPRVVGVGPSAQLEAVQQHALDAASRAGKAKMDPEEVKELQKLLLARGYDLGPAGVDGQMGRLSRLALEDFQRDAGLLPIGVLKNGQLDPATRQLVAFDLERLNKNNPVLKAFAAEQPLPADPVEAARPEDVDHPALKAFATEQPLPADSKAGAVPAAVPEAAPAVSAPVAPVAAPPAAPVVQGGPPTRGFDLSAPSPAAAPPAAPVEQGGPPTRGFKQFVEDSAGKGSQIVTDGLQTGSEWAGKAKDGVVSTFSDLGDKAKENGITMDKLQDVGSKGLAAVIRNITPGMK